MEKEIKINLEEIELNVLCDVVFSHWPDGLHVKALEINGLSSAIFLKSFRIDVENAIHEKLSEEKASIENDKLDFYDEGDR